MGYAPRVSVKSVVESLLATGVLSRGPDLAEADFAAAEAILGRELPADLREFYAAIGNGAGIFLPLLTGLEREVFLREDFDNSGDWFAATREARDSAVGFAVSHAEAPEDYPHPHGLLYIADYGCAIYFGVDLNHPELRVIEIEGSEESDDPAAEAAELGITLAYGPDQVQHDKLHWFAEAAESLESWLERLRRGGSHIRAGASEVGR